VTKVAKTKVEAELVKVLNLKKKVSEEPEDYRRRLVNAANALEDDEFEKLSADAQAWLQEAIRTIKKKKPVPEFEDDMATAEGEETEDEEETADEDEEEEEAPKKKVAKKAPKKAARRKSDDDEEDEDDDKGRRAFRAAEWRGPFKKVIIKSPKLSLDQVLEKVADKPISRGQANWVRRETLHTLRTMAAMDKYDTPMD